MGVIRDMVPVVCLSADPPFIASPDSNTLQIASGDSDAESSMHGRQRRRRRLHRFPRTSLTSLIGDTSRLVGGRKSRRKENDMFILSMIKEEDVGQVNIDNFMESAPSVFSRLNESEHSTARDIYVTGEEELSGNVQDKKNRCAYDPGSCMENLCSRFREALKRGRLPLGMLTGFEDRITSFFLDFPGDVYISEPLSNFERLLMHMTCQYHALDSYSFGEGDGRRMMLHNSHAHFTMPSTSLAVQAEKYRH